MVRSGARRILLGVMMAAAPAAMARSAHFQKWEAGEVVEVNMEQHRFTLHEAGPARESVFRWDENTKVFIVAAEDKPAATAGVEALQPGRRARVLWQKKGRQMLARRVLMSPSTP